MMNTLESLSRIIGRAQPEEPIAKNGREHIRNPGLAKLTNEELAQLIELTAKVEGADEGGAEPPPGGEMD